MREIQKKSRSIPFFKDVDWEKLQKREVPAPWKPNLKSRTDTSNFEDEFTEMAVDSPSYPSFIPGSLDGFENFSYVESYKSNTTVSLLGSPSSSPFDISKTETPQIPHLALSGSSNISGFS